MGWTDTIAASGFQMLMVCTGLLRYVHTTDDTILDLIPCDFVSNQILTQTVFTAKEAIPKLNVVHVTTTTKNPLRIAQMHSIVFEYIRYNPFFMASARNVEPYFRSVGDIRVW